MNMIFALLLLLGVLTLCVLGLLHPKYNDNLGHCVGMVIVILWAIAQVLRLAALKYMPPDDLWIGVGIFSFGMGTAVRTWLYKRKRVNHDFEC